MIKTDSNLDYFTFYNTLKQQLVNLDKTNTIMVGIHTGGYWVAQQLHADLNLTQPLFALSTTLQRDDFSTTGLHKQNQPSRLPMTVQGAHILLVDDVLHTGRTLRAALNELFEYGRPASVRLAILIDRGERELPFTADFCGGTANLTAGKSLVLLQTNTGLSLNITNKDKARSI